MNDVVQEHFPIGQKAWLFENVFVFEAEFPFFLPVLIAGASNGIPC